MSVETLVSSLTSAKADVLAALKNASTKTGSDFQYLLGTAMRESGLDSQAKSKASSATGLFQFIDQTWLSAVKRFGGRHGLGEYANAIRQGADGHYSVASRETKQAILALRKNPELSALMAGETAKETKQNLECALGREVCGGELYAAHFLGEGNAKRLIALNDKNPACVAADAFPEAAHANRSIFFHADGSPKSVREVYNWTTALPQAPKADALPAAPAKETPAPMIAMAMPQMSAVPGTEHSQSDSAKVYLSSFASRAFSNRAPAQTGPQDAVLPQRPLLLSPGVMEIFAALTPVPFAFGRR